MPGWFAFLLLVLVIVGFAMAFVRKGTTIKPDPENKPQNP
jgi:hypothetical protein